VSLIGQRLGWERLHWERLREPRVVRGALVVLAVLAAAAILSAGGWAWYRAAETRSYQAFADASAQVQRAQEPAATAEDRDRAIRALDSFIAEHARSSLVPQAAYRLGNVRYAAGQYGAARGAFELALAKGASGTLRTLCAASIGYTWEAEKEYGKADAAFQAALRSLGPRDFLYEELLTDLARVQESAGNSKAAVETYRRVLKDVPDSRRADDIRGRIATLESPTRR
jgi:tetratricopeptide (TPR) repeat protein